MSGEAPVIALALFMCPVWQHTNGHNPPGQECVRLSEKHARFRGAPRKSLRREGVGLHPLAASSHRLGFVISRYFGTRCL